MKTHLKFVSFTLAAVLLVSCGSRGSNPVATSAPPAGAPSGGSLESQTLYRVNQYRVSKGLPRLQPHPGLTQLARAHSNNMARRHEMSHDDFKKRSAKARRKYDMGAMAENVYQAQRMSPSGSRITTTWINSRGHRKNMEGNFTHAGMGIKRDGSDLYATLLLGNHHKTPSNHPGLEPYLIF